MQFSLFISVVLKIGMCPFFGILFTAHSVYMRNSQALNSSAMFEN